MLFGRNTCRRSAVALKSTDLALMTSMGLYMYRSGWGAVATAQPSPLDRGRIVVTPLSRDAHNRSLAIVTRHDTLTRHAHQA